MILYVYDKTTNEKKKAYKDITFLLSKKDEFIAVSNEEEIHIPKEGIKLVVYGH